MSAVCGISDVSANERPQVQTVARVFVDHSIPTFTPRTSAARVHRRNRTHGLHGFQPEERRREWDLAGYVVGSAMGSMVGSVLGSVMGYVMGSMMGSVLGSVLGYVMGSMAGSMVESSWTDCICWGDGTAVHHSFAYTRTAACLLFCRVYGLT